MIAQSFWLQFAFWGLIQFNTPLIHSRIRMVIMIVSPWNSLKRRRVFTILSSFPFFVGQSPNVKMTPPEDCQMMMMIISSTSIMMMMVMMTSQTEMIMRASCLLPMMLDDPSQCVLSRQADKFPTPGGPTPSMLVWWKHASKQKLKYILSISLQNMGHCHAHHFI